MSNCSNKKIKGVLERYSETLFEGCDYFTKLITETLDSKLIKIYNTSSIILSYSGVEARLNEMAKILLMIDFDEEFSVLKDFKIKERQLSIEEKWNIISNLLKANPWDKSKEPFQSFRTISALRNEIVHYKAEPLGKDETPTKSINGLMEMLKIKSDCSFVEDDCSTWLNDLLTSKNLGKWINEKTILLRDKTDELWSGNPYT
jgi:hypothetical protein